MPDACSSPFWCVSVNPAIDKRMRVPRLTVGRVNRVNEVRAEPGGKAAHVAMVLRVLGADPLWLGFAGGSTGEQLLSGLETTGIRAQPVMVSSHTRTNMEIIDDDGRVTEVLEPGTPLAETDWSRFCEMAELLFSQETRSGTVIASGSLPQQGDPSIYAKLAKTAHRHGHKIFLDTSGAPMRLALDSGLDLVKPNREEAEELVGEKIDDCRSAKKAAGRLIQMGARSAVVSLGHQGFVWQGAKDQDAYYARAVSVNVKSSVGCGDATLAAFAYAMSAQWNTEKTLRLAAACGAANCLADAPGRVLEADIRALEAQVRIEPLT